MHYIDRHDAGERLATALLHFPLVRPVVFGILRGGVPVAAPVAEVLRAPLGVIVTRRILAPGQPDQVLGAIACDGTVWIDEARARAVGAEARDIREECRRRLQEARTREARFGGWWGPVRGRMVIVADDGLATGASAVVAVRALKNAGAVRVVLAVPVGSPRALELLRREADDVLCLQPDAGFASVGQYYQDFRRVEDDEVKTILEGIERKRWRGRRSGSRGIPQT